MPLHIGSINIPLLTQQSITTKKDDYKGFFGGVYFANLADLKIPKLIRGEPYLSIWSKF